MKERVPVTTEETEMTKGNSADRSYTRHDRQGELYGLRPRGYWGTLVPVAALMLVLPLVLAFFLFLSGLVAVAVIGTGYAWWRLRKLRPVRPPADEEAIELAASEYLTLEPPGGKARGDEAER